MLISILSSKYENENEKKIEKQKEMKINKVYHLQF